MKKIVASILVLICMAVVAMASPARPDKYQYKQPDGSIIWLQNHGDEHFHWTTDEEGNVVEKGEDGYYHISSMDAVMEHQNQSRGGVEEDYARWSSHDNPYPTNLGQRKILCFVVEFSDVQFTLSDIRQKFHNLLNQEGYSENGAHGSVRDYYIENSRGLYQPTFDVYGPVTLSNPSEYYDNTGHAYRVNQAIIEAYNTFASQINIADYDTDDDGYVDMVLLYFAGYNEAEGGPSTSIWPHHSKSGGSFGNLGSKRFNRYFCTSELKGSEGADMCGIGTTCHEFAHSLGLPDMYDTNYWTSGYNGMTTGYFDLMASGNYNDDGRCPPYLSALERNMLGWMDDLTPLSGAGSYTLYPVHQNAGYTSTANMDGEYFIYEYRTKTGWDRYCSPNSWVNGTTGSNNGGLFIYHVDKSSRVISGSYTAGYLWENTSLINAFGGHPCYYLKIASDTPSTSYWFPGPSTVTSYTPLDWDDRDCGIELQDITVDGTKATFTVSALGTHKIQGTVTSYGNVPVAGATVVLSRTAYDFNAAPSTLPTDITTTTADDGTFTLDLAGNNQTRFVLSVSKAGYVSQSRNVTFPLEASYLDQNFVLEAQAGSGNLASYGNAFIDISADVPALTTPGSKSVKSVVWTVDGSDMATPTAKSQLAAGSHTYVATVVYYDGTSERVYHFVNK